MKYNINENVLFYEDRHKRNILIVGKIIQYEVHNIHIWGPYHIKSNDDTIHFRKENDIICIATKKARILYEQI